MKALVTEASFHPPLFIQSQVVSFVYPVLARAFDRDIM